MSLSDCPCGGHISLGPYASNVCDRCGNGVFAGPRIDWKARAEKAEAERDEARLECRDLFVKAESLCHQNGKLLIQEHDLKGERDAAQKELAELKGKLRTEAVDAGRFWVLIVWDPCRMSDPIRRLYGL